MEGFQRGGGRKKGVKVQGIRSINGRHKIDRRKLRIVWETAGQDGGVGRHRASLHNQKDNNNLKTKNNQN